MGRVRTEDKRQAILDAALDLFVERHYHGTAIPMIAERAGVADGTIYRYFINKESLVNELYRQKKDELVSFLTRPFRAGASLKERLSEIGTRYLEFFEAHPKEVCFLEKNHHESYLTPHAQAAELPLIQLIIGLLQEGKDQGIIKPIRNEIMLFILYGALTGMVEAYRRGLIPSLADAHAEVEECLWHAIRA